MFAPRSCGLVIFGLLAAVSAQDVPEREADLTEALLRWADAFDQRELDPRADFMRARVYGPLVEVGGLLARYRGAEHPYQNQQMLEKMITAAESAESVLPLHGLLAVAGVGLEWSPFDGDAQSVRDAAAGAAVRLMIARADAAALLRATAAGAYFDDLDYLDDRDDGPSIGARVAALRALALGRDEAGRALLLDAVRDDDPRVALAATEALDRRATAADLSSLVERLRIEVHPVVAQALTRAVGAVLGRAGDAVDPEACRAALDAGIGRLGSVGWRNDLEIVDLIGAHPTPPGVDALIDLLDLRASRGLRPRDREFAPVLRARALRVLRSVTGTIAPGDDAAAWREFWNAERARIELRPFSPGAGQGRTSSGGGFFGIEVRGRETAFVLDVSRSMGKRIGGVGEDAWQSRLDVAARQLLQVAQDMPRAWRFRVIAFADTVRVWNERGARADARTLRALTAFLAEQRPGGRTDLVGALRTALGVDALRFGKESRNPVDEVFVLSDGLPGDADGPLDPEEVLAWVRDANRYQKVRIHAVMAGSGAGVEFLRRLAAENDGQFVQR